MGLGEVSLAIKMVQMLGLTADQLAAMEASGEMPVPDILFDRALDYIGGPAWKDGREPARSLQLRSSMPPHHPNQPVCQRGPPTQHCPLYYASSLAALPSSHAAGPEGDPP